MRVLVTGGSGFVGSHTVAALVAAGHEVRVLARSVPAVTPALLPLGVPAGAVEAVAGDVTDPIAVRRAVQGCDAVVNAAGVYSFDSRDHARMLAVNERSAEVVIGESVRAGVDPVVHVSTVAVLGGDGRLITDSSPVRRVREAYAASKAAAERVARRYQDDGAPVVITYPSSLLGPHDPRLGDGVARLRNELRGLMPVWPTGGLPIGDVRTVAELHVLALRPGLGPRRLFDAGTYLSTRQYVESVRRVTGRRLPAVRVPARVMLPLAALASTVQRALPVHLPAEYGAVHTCASQLRVDLAGVDTLGVIPPPIDVTVADTVRWLHERGEVTARQAGAAAAVPAAGARSGVRSRT